MRSLVRRPLAVIFLTVFIDLLGFGIVIPILPTYAERFGASALAVGLLATTYSILQLLFAPIWGRLSDRVGRRPVIVATALGSAVAYATFGVGEALWLLFLARGLGGVCGANIATAQAYIADVTTAENRARGMSIIGASFGMGFIFGPALGGLATHAAGVRAPFFVASGLALVNAVWAWFALPEPPRRQAVRRRGLRSYGDAFGRPRLAFFLGIFLVVTYAFANIESTFALFAHHEHGFDERQNAYMFTWIGIVLTTVQLAGTSRLTRRFGEVPLIVAGTALMGIGAATVPLAAAWWQLVLPTSLIACGNALNTPSLMASISKAAPEDRQGEMLGVAQSVGALGRILGPASGGFLFDHAGHAWPSWTAGLLMFLASATVLLRGRS